MRGVEYRLRRTGHCDKPVEPLAELLSYDVPYELQNCQPVYRGPILCCGRQVVSSGPYEAGSSSLRMMTDIRAARVALRRLPLALSVKAACAGS